MARETIRKWSTRLTSLLSSRNKARTLLIILKKKMPKHAKKEKTSMKSSLRNSQYSTPY